MKKIKVTIIVPIHNSALYLQKCVDSCLNQTLQGIEIILVDDASTDNSPSLISNYAQKYADKIIPVYLSKNIRQGGARNCGIRIAQGEYVAFVDSDDWIEPNMCEELYWAAKKQNADMAGGNFFISTDINDKPQQLNYTSLILGKENVENLKKYFCGQGYFWNRIYKRKMIIDNQIFFPENVFYEDSYFNFMTGLYSNQVVKVEKNFYHYYQSENSTIRVRNNKRAYDRIKVARLIVEDCYKKGFVQEYKNIIDNKFINMSAGNILYICLGSFDKPDKERLSEINSDIKNYCPKYRYNPYYHQMPADLKWYLNAVAHSPKFAIWCYRHHFHTVFNYIDAIKNKIHRKE